VGDAAQQVDRLNQDWEFDSTPADVMLADGRHSLIGVIDVFSRRLKLLVSKTSRATAVAALIRAALLDWGVPETAKTDNGADYVSKHIVGVFSALQVEQILCPPFTPEAKPHIERAFKTFAHSFQELMPNYIGHSVAQRKDIESRRTFAERLGQADSIVEINMTADELQRYCDRWCEAIYHQNVHRRLDGRTPAAVARIWRGTERRIEDVRALDILLAEAPDNNGIRTIGKKGVRVGNNEYIAAELAGLEGKAVRVKLDPADLGTIYLFDEDGSFICVAQDPLRTGIDRAEVAARLHNLQKEKMSAAKKEAKKIARKQAVEQIHEEILQHRERQIANIVELPRPSIPYMTPALDEAARAAEAIQRNQRELDEIDELIAEADAGPELAGVSLPAMEISPKPAEPKVIPIFATMSDRYNWIKHRERSAPGLTRQEYDWLSEYYTSTGGRMYLQLEGDLRKRMGLREEAQSSSEG
jgi:transposase InsO family protein